MRSGDRRVLLEGGHTGGPQKSSRRPVRAEHARRYWQHRSLQPEIGAHALPDPCGPGCGLATGWAVRRLKRQVRWSGIPISFRIFHSLL